jgi:ribosomal protein S2
VKFAHSLKGVKMSIKEELRILIDTIEEDQALEEAE